MKSNSRHDLGQDGSGQVEYDHKFNQPSETKSKDIWPRETPKYEFKMMMLEVIVRLRILFTFYYCVGGCDDILWRAGTDNLCGMRRGGV
jgi:hypothetical protein